MALHYQGNGDALDQGGGHPVAKLDRSLDLWGEVQLVPSR